MFKGLSMLGCITRFVMCAKRDGVEVDIAIYGRESAVSASLLRISWLMMTSIGSFVEMVRGHQCRDARACSARASVQRCEGIGYFVDDECRFDERRFDAHLMRNKVTLR